jgi:hypothetical protein
MQAEPDSAMQTLVHPAEEVSQLVPQPSGSTNRSMQIPGAKAHMTRMEITTPITKNTFNLTMVFLPSLLLKHGDRPAHHSSELFRHP